MKYWELSEFHCVFCGRLPYERKPLSSKVKEKLNYDGDDLTYSAQFFCAHCRKGFSLNYDGFGLFTKYKDDQELIKYLKLSKQHDSVVTDE